MLEIDIIDEGRKVEGWEKWLVLAELIAWASLLGWGTVELAGWVFRTVTGAV